MYILVFFNNLGTDIYSVQTEKRSTKKFENNLHLSSHQALSPGMFKEHVTVGKLKMSPEFMSVVEANVIKFLNSPNSGPIVCGYANIRNQHKACIRFEI